MTSGGLHPHSQPFDSATDITHVVFLKGEPSVWVSTGAFVVAPLRYVTAGTYSTDRLHLKMVRAVLEEALTQVDQHIQELS